MVDTGALTGAQRRAGIEDHLRAAAVDAVITVRERLTVQIPLVPLDRLGRVRGRDVHMVIVGRARDRRHRDERHRCHDERWNNRCPVHVSHLTSSGGLFAQMPVQQIL